MLGRDFSLISLDSVILLKVCKLKPRRSYWDIRKIFLEVFSGVFHALHTKSVTEKPRGRFFVYSKSVASQTAIHIKLPSILKPSNEGHKANNFICMEAFPTASRAIEYSHKSIDQPHFYFKYYAILFHPRFPRNNKCSKLLPTEKKKNVSMN